MKKLLSVLTLLLAMATSSMAQNCNAAWVDTVRNGCSIQFYGYGVAGSNPPVHMYWQFGDGTVHSGMSNQGVTLAPTHSYATSGTYTVCLHITDSINNCYNVYCDTVTVSCGNGPCKALFTDTVHNGCTVSFYNYSQGVTNGTWFSWNFGDGNYGWQTHPTHTYSQSGWYHVCLTMTDSANNCYDTYCDSIYVNCNGSTQGPCNASFTANASGQGCTWNFQSTSQNASYMQWWWNDGSPVQPVTTHHNGTVSHTFPGNGTYNVCLYLYDSTQQWCDSTCMTIVVNCSGQTGPCVASFQSYPDTANPCTVYFWSTSTGGSYMQWWWNDGSPAQSITPHGGSGQTHTFPGSGTYNVCLYLYDSTQQWCDSTCMTITVNCPTGISEASTISRVNVYPNPADDIVTIEAINNGSDDVEISLMDVSGRRVYFTNLNDSHTIRHSIPVQNYNNGIYMLNVRSGSSIVTEKLIIH